MTALAALFHRDGRSASRDAIDRMVRSLVIFGPDGQRSATYGPAALGCAMRWTTPEDVGVPQPVLGGDGRYAMVFDGRIDNREDLADALGLTASAMAGLSDGRLMMRCFERWNRDAFTRIIGDWAFILWDEAEQQMMLVTDPVGVRGMVYYATDACLYVATMPRGLHALPEVPRELNEERIADALCQLMAGNNDTSYVGIHTVPRGSLMTITADRIETHRYYRMTDHVKPVRYARDEDYTEAARELLEKAVRARLRSRYPIGALMSGGLDSSSVAVTASAMLEQQGTRLPTFTSVPQDDWDGRTEAHVYGDETPFVHAIAARHPNIDLNLVKAEGLAHYYRQDELLRLSEAPMRGAGLMGWMHTIFEQAKSRDIKVMLVGDSGNMTLSYRGDGVYYDLFTRGRWLQLARELWAINRTPRGVVAGLYGHVLPGLLSSESWDKLLKLRGIAPLEQRWFRYSTAQRSFGEAMRIPERAREAGFDYFGKPASAKRAHWHAMMDGTGGGMHQFSKAFSAMHDIELRDPLGDRRLIEWSFGVPEDQFHRNGVPRQMIKRVMDGVLPDEVLHKKLLTGRINSDWQVRMAGDLPRMREDIAAMRDDPDVSRMVDLDRLEAWVNDWPTETVTDPKDDRRFALMVNLPMALNAARFVELVKGRNR